jgi:hypothetical protein
MDSGLIRRDPVDGAAVWKIGADEECKFRLRSFLVSLYLLIPLGLTATLGTIRFSTPEGGGIADFWPASAFQIVFSVWFGVHGAIAGVIGPMLGNGLIGESAFLFVPANALQSCLTGLWFRSQRLDPRLRGPRDWIGILLVGCVLGNAIGALFGVTESWIRGGPQAANELGFYARRWLQWFGGNAVPCLVLAPLLMKSGSSMIVRGPLFCPRFWKGARGLRTASKPPHRIEDIPMFGKLMILVLITGMMPLYILAAWSVWDIMKTADVRARFANQSAVSHIRTEVERHESLLEGWALTIDDPDLSADRRDAMIAEWAGVRDAFSDLQLSEWERLREEIPPALQSSGGELPVIFYAVPDPENPSANRIRAVARLRSTPDKVLAGLAVWRQEEPAFGLHEQDDIRALLVFDSDGRELYREAPPELSDWVPPPSNSLERLDRFEHAGLTWYGAEADAPQRGWRFVAVTSVRMGLTSVLASLPSGLAVLLNLAIFGSLIVGMWFSRRLAQRVLSIAERVRETGAAPGTFYIDDEGDDELGYLSGALNRMSRDLRVYVDELKTTTAENERLNHQIELARRLQQSVLPASLPPVPGYELAGVSLPAYEVGGDFFDYFLIGRDRVGLMIGDAVGKGLPAAMLISETRGIARAATLDGLTPDRVLGATNRAVVTDREPADGMVTMFCGVLDARNHRLEYANAGHNPPLLSRDGQVEWLKRGGVPLAVLEDEGYGVSDVELAPGDTLIMFTDGVVEAFDPQRQLFEIGRLEAVIRSHAGQPSEDLIEAIVSAVRAFRAEAPQSDDLTVLVLRRLNS